MRITPIPTIFRRKGPLYVPQTMKIAILQFSKFRPRSRVSLMQSACKTGRRFESDTFRNSFLLENRAKSAKNRFYSKIFTFSSQNSTLTSFNLFPRHFHGHMALKETLLDMFCGTWRRGLLICWLDPTQGTKTRQKRTNSYRPLRFAIWPAE